MPDDNEHNYPPTRAEILERFGWQPGEKEQLAAEMAERQRQMDAEAREAERVREAERQRPTVVGKTYAQKKQEETAATNYWKDYIKRELDQRDRVLFKAIAVVVVGEERRASQADDDIMSIVCDVRNRFDEMEARLRELRAATPAMRCDGNARDLDLARVREWRH